MKKLILIFSLVIAGLAQAQECKDVIYPTDGKSMIFNCCIDEVKYGNIVYYTKDSTQHFIEAISIIKSGLKIPLKKSAQETLTMQSLGKSKVYFVRTERLGWAINFKYFDGGQFIGIFNNKGYIVYECNPGEHVLWAVSENADYITAILEAGQTYVVLANVKMGGMKARVELIPLSAEDEKELEEVVKIIEKKEEVLISEEDREEYNLKYADFIDTKLFEFDELVKENHTFYQITNSNVLSEDMLIKKD